MSNRELPRFEDDPLPDSIQPAPRQSSPRQPAPAPRAAAKPAPRQSAGSPTSAISGDTARVGSTPNPEARPSTTTATSKRATGSRPVLKPPSRPVSRAAGGSRQPSSIQIVFGSILAISLLLAINFSSRIAAGQRIRSELGVLQATITAEQIRATQLRAELSLIDTDSYVQQWARSAEGRMILPGEKLIIPVPGAQAAQAVPTPQPVNPLPSSARDTGEIQNWSLWWQLFFDNAPPGSN